MRAGWRPAAILLGLALGCHKTVVYAPPAQCAAGRVEIASLSTLRFAGQGWVGTLQEAQGVSVQWLDFEGRPVETFRQVTGPDESVVDLAFFEDQAYLLTRVGAGSHTLRAIGRGRRRGATRVYARGAEEAVVLSDERGVRVFFETPEGAFLSERVDAGAGLSRCDAPLMARTVALAGDDLYGVAAHRAGAIEVLRADAGCATQQRTTLQAPINESGRYALAAHRDGVLLTWATGAGASYLAAVSRGGAVQVRPRVLDSGLDEPRWLVARSPSGARGRARVLGLERSEVDTRVVLIDLDDRLEMTDQHGLLRVAGVRWETLGVAPWGGALGVFRLADPTLGATMHRDARLFAGLRVCP
ncbi:MAG: hypothetical protein JNK72_14880 [Myxococcales bacterium]|nr:hypothetical protein [Myxococcales bacterium]